MNLKQSSIKKYIAEFLGTFTLVFIGCGTAMITGGSVVPTALAFGLAIVALAYSIGNISGCHVNPAVSLAMLLTGELSLSDFIGYIIAQFSGAFVGTGFLAMIFGMGLVNDMTGVAYTDTKDFLVEVAKDPDKAKFISDHNLTHHLNGFGANTMTHVGGNHFAGFLVEIILTCIFVFAILGVTSKKQKHGSFGGLVIGLTLTGVHLLGIGLTGTSVNPARSFGPAFFAMFGGNFDGIAGLWAFILGPCIGAALAAIVYKILEGDDKPVISAK